MTQNLLIYLNHDLIDFWCIKKLDMTYPGVRDNRSTLNTKTGYDEELTGIKDRAGSLNESDF